MIDLLMLLLLKYRLIQLGLIFEIYINLLPYYKYSFVIIASIVPDKRNLFSFIWLYNFIFNLIRQLFHYL